MPNSKTILSYPKDEIAFETLSGELIVRIQPDLYELNFPSRKPVTASLPGIISGTLSIQPKEALRSRDFVLVY